MKSTLAGMRIASVLSLLVVLSGMAMAADEVPVRAMLQPRDQRRPAPEFALRDGAEKKIELKDFRGRVVLLDFWATWCHGCVQEMPWFVEFHDKYGQKGLTVIGVSMDEDGWKEIKPFLERTKVPYRIVLGDAVAGKRYGIAGLPDTFLIDRQGRIAASYAGLVDKDDVERNLRVLLAER